MLRSEQFLVLGACALLVAAAVIFSKPARAASELHARRPVTTVMPAAPGAGHATPARQRGPAKVAAPVTPGYARTPAGIALRAH